MPISSKKVFKRAVFVVAGLLALGLVALGASGCRRGCHRFDDPEKIKKVVLWKVNDILDEVDATDAQRQAFGASATALIEDIHKTRKAHEQNRPAVREELLKPAPDAAALHAMLDKHLDEMRAVAHRGVDEFLKAWNTLTPQQKQALLDELKGHCGK